MASYEGIQQAVVGAVAGADLRTHQFKYVKLSAAAPNTVVLCDATTDDPIGILQDTPNTGQAANVCWSGISKLVADAVLVPGNRTGPSTTSRGAVLAAGMGRVLVGAANANEVATVLLK